MKEKLRICHYNILNGGEERLDKIFKVIDEIKPDICGILEAVGWQDNLSYFESWARKLNYKFFKVSVANSKYNIAVFSKIAIEVKTIKEGFRHVVLEAILKEGHFTGSQILFIHLSPVSEDNRLSEIEELKKYLKGSSTIIMGDFNSLSVHDPYKKDSLLESLQKIGVKKYGDKSLRFDVMGKIESFGLIDAARYLKVPFSTSTPTPSNKDITHAAHLRIDYALLSKELKEYLKKIEILKNENTNIASDHYPLFIDLEK